MINTSYVAMVEHLVLFYVEQTKTREDAELKLIKFLTALKFHSGKWERANYFAKLLGI